MSMTLQYSADEIPIYGGHMELTKELREYAEKEKEKRLSEEYDTGRNTTSPALMRNENTSSGGKMSKKIIRYSMR